MLLPMTSNVAPMSAATPIQRVTSPRVARTRNTALVAREKTMLNRHYGVFRHRSRKNFDPTMTRPKGEFAKGEYRRNRGILVMDSG